MARKCSKYSGKKKENYLWLAGPDGKRSGKGLVDLERRCQDKSREIQMLNKRQEIFQSAIEGKLRVQEALQIAEKEHDLWMCQNEKEEAKRLQGVTWTPPRNLMGRGKNVGKWRVEAATRRRSGSAAIHYRVGLMWTWMAKAATCM